jgi:uncharacterized protein (DUF488 family)
MAQDRPILTIGHSRHSWDRFAALLAAAGVEAVADIRSVPRSRFSPHFNKNELAARLAARNIAYLFLGAALGGRPQDPGVYTDGVADYEKMAASPEFRLGLTRLVETATQHSLTVMCSEADPLECHRFLLVGRALAEAGIAVAHILRTGEIISHEQAEDRLLDREHLAEEGLLPSSRDERLGQAYKSRSRKFAFLSPRGRGARHSPKGEGGRP